MLKLISKAPFGDLDQRQVGSGRGGVEDVAAVFFKIPFAGASGLVAAGEDELWHSD